MKILILANYDVGLYQFRKELIQELLKCNEVIISLPYGDLVVPLKTMGCKFIDTPLERRGINPITDIHLIKKYFTILKSEKPDLVISYTIKPNIYGGFACRRLKIPYDMNITGLGTAFENDGILKRLVTYMYKYSCKRAHTVYFENSENKKIFIDERIVKSNQACLLSGAGVNLEHYSLAEYPEKTEPVKFLFMGRVMKEKGIEELFAAMDRLYEEGYKCELDILGGYEENYEAAIHSYENKGWMKYHGYIKDVRPFIKQAHCFVLPSWHEGMANTNLECAAMGRPVITSNIHGCMEAVEDGVSGYLFECKNVDSLYEKMKLFTELSYEQRKNMGLAGRKRMEEIFDKKKVVAKTIENL